MVSLNESGESALRYRTTIGWSLITSAIVTFLLTILPGASIWWGGLLLVTGAVILLIRKS